MRVVVCALGAFVRPGELPASTFLDRARIYGGERSMYEIAAAAASTGFSVELRGDLSQPVLEAIVARTGATIETDLPPRRAEPEDVVIVPEGITDHRFYAAVRSSGRVVMALLGPPGLFGPALSSSFSPPDPMTVPLNAVGAPHQYRELSGFELWTNSPRIAAEAHDAGVGCRFIGTGQPIPFPAPAPKQHAVAFVAANRWAPVSRRVASALSMHALEISEGDRESTVRALASARLVLLPFRIEGQSRLQLEARAVGTVPIALRSNRYAAGVSDEGGAVLVDTVEEMAPTVETLLKRPRHIAHLAERAVTTARSQMDWEPYVGRVAAALRALSLRPATSVSRGMV